MNIPLRLFSGCILQVVPFAFLCFYPFRDYLRYTRQKTVFTTAALLVGEALIFSLAGTFFASILPNEPLLFNVVNSVFMLGLLPCLFWYLYAITAIWQKKLFIQYLHSYMQKAIENRFRRWAFCTPESCSYGFSSKCFNLC